MMMAYERHTIRKFVVISCLFSLVTSTLWILWSPWWKSTQITWKTLSLSEQLSLQLRKQRLTSFCTGCFQSKLRLKLPRIKYHANFFNTIHIRIRNKPAALPCNSQNSRYLDIHLVSGIRMACANPAWFPRGDEGFVWLDFRLFRNLTLTYIFLTISVENFNYFRRSKYAAILCIP